MFKLLNKKKNNKGFTLVELVIVVAILAILVGILAPQYTKYVEKSRQSADASNLENIVEGFKVAAADVDYDMIPTTGKATFTVVITADGTKITATGEPTTKDKTWADALKEYTGYTFKSGEANGALKLKSSNWEMTDTAKTKGIEAIVEIATTGAVTVTYNPASIKDVSNKK